MLQPGDPASASPRTISALDLVLRKRPDPSFELVQCEIHCGRRQPQGIFAQVAAFIQNGQQHEPPSKLEVELPFRVSVGKQQRPLQFAVVLHHDHAGRNEIVLMKAAERVAEVNQTRDPPQRREIWVRRRLPAWMSPCRNTGSCFSYVDRRSR